MARPYRYIGANERRQIEALFNAGVDPREIAQKIGFHAATVYREIERGIQEGADGRLYIAMLAEKSAKANLRNRGRSCMSDRPRGRRKAAAR